MGALLERHSLQVSHAQPSPMPPPVPQVPTPVPQAMLQPLTQPMPLGQHPLVEDLMPRPALGMAMAMPCLAADMVQDDLIQKDAKPQLDGQLQLQTPPPSIGDLIQRDAKSQLDGQLQAASAFGPYLNGFVCLTTDLSSQLVGVTPMLADVAKHTTKYYKDLRNMGVDPPQRKVKGVSGHMNEGGVRSFYVEWDGCNPTWEVEGEWGGMVCRVQYKLIGQL